MERARVVNMVVGSISTMGLVFALSLWVGVCVVSLAWYLRCLSGLVFALSLWFGVCVCSLDWYLRLRFGMVFFVVAL